MGLIYADPMLETLKASLGVPTKPAEPPLEARDKAAFQQVGMQAWQASEARQSDKGQAVTPMVLQKAARDYLCACKPEVATTNHSPAKYYSPIGRPCRVLDQVACGSFGNEQCRCYLKSTLLAKLAATSLCLLIDLDSIDGVL